MEIEKLLMLYMNMKALEGAMHQGFKIIVDRDNGFWLCKDGHEENIGMTSWAATDFVETLVAGMGKWQTNKT